jgi:hypothetical protein
MCISVRCDITLSDDTSRRLSWTLIQSQEAGRNWKVVAPSGEQGVALDNKQADRVANTLVAFEGSEFDRSGPVLRQA